MGWLADFSLRSLNDDAMANVMDTIVALIPPHGNKLILPALPSGYSTAVAQSSHPAIVAADGSITTPSSDTIVEIVLRVIRTSDHQSRETVPMKVFIAGARPAPATVSYQDNFLLRQGLFITWSGAPDGSQNSIVFSDGSRANTMDQFANAANVNAVADQAALFRFDHVVLMDFHGAGTTLHPCVALDAWRGPGFTSKRDLIGEMIAAFKARNIKVFLFTHPLDGHDYTPEQQTRLGFNDPTDGYRKWNDFVNAVHAEIVERYGNDITGIGMDSEFGQSSDPRWAGKLDLPRLRTTILSRKPWLSLSALSGPNDTCEFGLKEVWRPSWLDPWRSRTETDYDVEKWPAYRRGVAIVQGNHWATTVPPSKGTARLSGPQLFRYSVLQAAAGTEGPGVQWAVSPYTDGTWEKGAAQSLAALSELVRPVHESLRQVYPSTSYPTAEGSMLSKLPHGIVATKKCDDSAEYIHVLNPPPGKLLTLPAPADGKRFLSAALLANGHPVKLLQSFRSLELTLDTADNWIPYDTVIKLVTDPASSAPRNLALHGCVTSSSSMENTAFAVPSPWGRIRLVDGQRDAQAAPASWSVKNLGWSSCALSSNQPQWVQVDLGQSQRINTVCLYPRNDPDNTGQGFPVNFEILVSGNGTDWVPVATVTNQPLPNRGQTYTFNPAQARYVRVAASLLRLNPNDSGHLFMQFAEMEVYNR